MTKHTPGPWKLFETPREIEILVSDRSAPVNWPSNGLRIALVRGKRHGRGGDGEWSLNDADRANAAIMRAAPDMLEALKDCERAAADTARQLGNTAAEPLLSKIRVAIAKAEGRAP